MSEIFYKKGFIHGYGKGKSEERKKTLTEVAEMCGIEINDDCYTMMYDTAQMFKFKLWLAEQIKR